MSDPQSSPFDLSGFLRRFACREPGPVGKNDYGDPMWWLREALCHPKLRVPIGINDALLQPATAPAGPTPTTTETPVALGPLDVSQGQITFDAEGNDVSTSQYFSRRAHWPGTANSGVTIGRGYDMGGRGEAVIRADLIAAGLDADRAGQFAAAHGMRGNDASSFVSENRDDLGEIPHSVQRNLFENIYPTYVTTARARYEQHTSSGGNPLADRVAWDDLDPAIRDVLVDVVYQGFQGVQTMLHARHNDFDELIQFIEGSPELSQYEPGRQRANYLRNHRPE
jgi:hypothetical protein